MVLVYSGIEALRFALSDEGTVEKLLGNLAVDVPVALLAMYLAKAVVAIGVSIATGMMATIAISTAAVVGLTIFAGLLISAGLSAAANYFGLKERLGKAINSTLLAAKEGVIHVGVVIYDAHNRLNRRMDMFGRKVSRYYICGATFGNHCN